MEWVYRIHNSLLEDKIRLKGVLNRIGKLYLNKEISSEDVEINFEKTKVILNNIALKSNIEVVATPLIEISKRAEVKT